MNRLQLTQRVRSESGLSGTGPSTTVNQTGEMLRIVNWTDDAWRSIQNARLWDWQWTNPTVTILASTNVTAGAISANRYVHDSARIGTSRLVYTPWERWQRNYTTIAAGTPTEWTIRPDHAFVVNAIPTADTAITVECYSLPTDMTADADTPAMPDSLHMAIVWLALSQAADYDEAGVSRKTARAKYGEVLGDLLSEATPVVELGGPLL